MPVCRSLLYLSAAAAAVGNVGAVTVPAIGLGIYVLGISLIARSETGTGAPARWPLLLLVAPLAVAADLSGTGGLPFMTLVCFVLLCLLLGGAVLSHYRVANTPRLVGRLIAGIILVDWLFVRSAQAPVWPSLAFAVLLASALLLQRRVPAS